jgi:uncharacterized protein YacL (UPF0231 family)
MEYEFIHDATTGEASARFSLEHEVMGPWIEVELGRDSSNLNQLLSALDKVEQGQSKEILITGSEYPVTLTLDVIEIQTNASLNGSEPLPDMLTDEHINLDQNEMAGCGIDDFRLLLLSWAKFTQIPINLHCG